MIVKVHPAALLDICSICTRDTTAKPICGGIYGSPDAVGPEVWTASEFKHDGQVDLSYLAQRDELLRSTNPRRELLGWFVVVKDLEEPWVRAYHQQIASLVANPLLCVFSIETGGLTKEIPLRPYYVLDGQFHEVPMETVMTKSEEVAVNDVISAKFRTGEALNGQLAKQSSTFEQLRQRFDILQGYLERAMQGESVDGELLARIVNVVELLDRSSGQRPDEAEINTVVQVLTAIVLQTDQVLISKIGK